MASLSYLSEDGTLRVKIGARDNADEIESGMSALGWTCIYGEDTMLVFEGGLCTKEDARQDIKKAAA